MRYLFLIISFFTLIGFQGFSQSVVDDIDAGRFSEAVDKIGSVNDSIERNKYQIILESTLGRNKQAKQIFNQIESKLDSEDQAKFRFLIAEEPFEFNKNISEINELINLDSSQASTEIYFWLTKNYLAIDSANFALEAIRYSINLQDKSSELFKLKQLMLLADALNGLEKKRESFVILSNLEQLINNDTIDYVREYGKVRWQTEILAKKGILLRKLGEVKSSNEHLQQADMLVYSHNELWALELKKQIYSAYQINFFMQGDSQKLFAYNLKSQLNLGLIQGKKNAFFDEISIKPIASNENLNQSNKKLNPRRSNPVIPSWVWISLGSIIIVSLGIIYLMYQKRKRLMNQMTQEKEEINEAFKLYRNEILKNSSNESQKIIKELSMLTNRQKKWSKKLTDLAVNGNKIKKSELLNEIAGVSQSMKADIQLDEKSALLGDKVRKVSKDFKERLKVRYPDLIRSEIELCSLIRLKMSNKEIAEVRNISISSARTARYRLKKKLNIPENLDLEKVLGAI